MCATSRLLFLTGFMGAGKTTVGKQLASHLAIPFIDLDAEIERKAGRTIKEIFAQEGEPHFRQLEHDALHELSQQGDCAVVATGGGLVVAPENRRMMRDSGIIINLQVTYAEVVKRLVGDISRPLFCDRDKEAVQQLMTSRAAAYADADLVVATADKTPQQIAQEIQRWLSQ